MTSKKADRKGKKTVAIVGMAKSTRHLAPWNDNDVEIWVLNESHAHNYTKRITRIAQLHPSWDYMRANNFNDPIYPAFLRNTPWTQEDIDRIEHMRTYKDLPRGFPEVKVNNKRRPEDLEIILLEEDENVVGKTSIFPFMEILEDYPNNKQNVRYFTSSAPYLIALAIHEGFERIEIYGFEMSSQEEYAYQKPCMEFWMGVAIGKGVEIYLPTGCHLLGETEELYGYDKLPGYTKMHAEIRKNELSRTRADAQAKVNLVQGEKKHLVDQLVVAQNKKDNAWVQKLQEQLLQIQNREVQALLELNVIHGATQEATKIHNELKMLPTSKEIRPIIPKSIFMSSPKKEKK
ncbi:MAG: hypothetical protein DRJ03_19875 [Chloroflexi bacterium]|nr:MAG: hypothetical protein DRJ03_19875 [Chloroflexota bacterium]